MEYLNPCGRFAAHADDIRRELLTPYTPARKDILIVVHDQLPFVQECITSVLANTKDCEIYVWDNASGPETHDWLKSQPIHLTRSDENLGFVIPNNRLAALGGNPYIVLLNSDTTVRRGWDEAIIAHLQAGYAQVGYVGGWLNEDGKGDKFGFGPDVDYIPGWCFGISRATYDQHGLFDEGYEFAYCEDSDYSLRLQAAGERLYALHLNFVEHFENQTIRHVNAAERDCRPTFEKNHARLKARWQDVLGRKCLFRKDLL